MPDHGHPIRSDELTRETQEGATALEEAQRELDNLQRKLLQTQLAVRAAGKQRPAGVRAGSVSTAMLECTPDLSSDPFGPFVGATRVDSTMLFSRAPQGSGPVEILQPGGIYAKLSEQAEESFLVQVQPSYLVRYNELMVLPIGGPLTVSLQSEHGYVDYRADEGKLFRLDKKRTFTGRAQIKSQARQTHVDGRYIHTFGSLELRDSSFAPSYSLRASFVAPETGSYSFQSVRLHPSGEPVSFSLYQDGTEVANDLTISKGTTLEFRVQGLSLQTASHLAVDYAYDAS